MQIDVTTAKKPSVLRRLGALLYDSVLLLAILMIAIGIVTIPYDAITGHPYYEETLALTLVRLYALAVIAAFYVYFWTHGGQTLGMRAWRIRVVGNDGRPIGVGAALMRFVWSVVSLVPAGLGLWWSLFNREKLAWHDQRSQTRLVMLEKGA